MALSTYATAARTAAQASTVYSAAYIADHLIDDALDSLSATTITSAVGNWLAVRVPSGTRVGPVAIYNRRDDASHASWLGSVEVWLGSAPGNT